MQDIASYPTDLSRLCLAIAAQDVSPWKSVYGYFRLWSLGGVWARLHDFRPVAIGVIDHLDVGRAAAAAPGQTIFEIVTESSGDPRFSQGVAIGIVVWIGVVGVRARIEPVVIIEQVRRGTETGDGLRQGDVAGAAVAHRIATTGVSITGRAVVGEGAASDCFPGQTVEPVVIVKNGAGDGADPFAHLVAGVEFVSGGDPVGRRRASRAILRRRKRIPNVERSAQQNTQQETDDCRIHQIGGDCNQVIPGSREEKCRSREQFAGFIRAAHGI
jgi:hypothetical protein